MEEYRATLNQAIQLAKASVEPFHPVYIRSSKVDGYIIDRVVPNGYYGPVWEVRPDWTIETYDSE